MKILNASDTSASKGTVNVLSWCFTNTINLYLLEFKIKGSEERLEVRRRTSHKSI